MADRRTDDTPLAPRRSLNGPTPQGEPETTKRPLTERVSAAIASAGTSVSSAASSAGRSEGGRRESNTSTAGARATRHGATPATSTRGTARPHGTRKARLRLSHVDPWSVMKTAFLLSIAFGIVTVVAVAVVWSVLGAAGVWDSMNKTVSDVIGGDSANTFDVQNYVGTSRVMGFTMIVAVVDVVLITAITTLGAFLYNLAAALLGGVEVTLAEDEH
jgi:hypothetical protein